MQHSRPLTYLTLELTVQGNLGNVESVTFSSGDLALSLTNDWPVTLSMVIDIVDLNNNTILSYSFNNLAPNGGSSTQSASLVGVSLPASMGLSISSVSSPGTGSTSVPIDLNDAITFGIGYQYESRHTFSIGK